MSEVIAHHEKEKYKQEIFTSHLKIAKWMAQCVAKSGSSTAIYPCPKLSQIIGMACLVVLNSGDVCNLDHNHYVWLHCKNYL